MKKTPRVIVLTFGVFLCQFSSKDKAGNWKWNVFSVIDYYDFEDTQIGGFIFNVIDGAGKQFAVDY